MSDLNSKVKAMIDAIDTTWLHKAKRPFMQYYVEDFRSAVVNQLPPDAVGIYHFMLMMQWERGEPVRLEADYYRKLRSFTGFDPRIIKRVVNTIVSSGDTFFEEMPDGSGDYWNRRIVKDLYAFHQKHCRSPKPQLSDSVGGSYGVSYGVANEEKPTKSTKSGSRRSSTRVKAQNTIKEDSPNSGESQTPTDSDLPSSDKSSEGLSIPPQAPEPTPPQASPKNRRKMTAEEKAEKDAERKRLQAEKDKAIAAACAREFNQFCEDNETGAKLQKLTGERAKAIVARLNEWREGRKPGQMSVEDYVAIFRDALDKVAYSSFLLGQTTREFNITFDFLGQKKSFTKLMEGGYGNGGVPKRSRKSQAMTEEEITARQYQCPETGEMLMR